MVNNSGISVLWAADVNGTEDLIIGGNRTAHDYRRHICALNIKTFVSNLSKPFFARDDSRISGIPINNFRYLITFLSRR